MKVSYNTPDKKGEDTVRKYLVYLLVLVVCIAPAACVRRAAPEQPAVITENVLLYYGSEGNEEFVTEERQVTYREGEDKYAATLQELITGPDNQAYVANIPEDTGVYGTIKQNRNLIVNLSSEFLSFGGSVAEIVAVGSIVNTLTQFTEIDRVKILVEGEEYIGPSGEPRGFMEAFTRDAAETDTVTLYFGNDQATAVVAETRTVSIPPGAAREDILRIVLEELIKGPQRQELFKTIPAEVTVRSVNIVGETVSIDFSEEMHTRHWGGAAGESMTINSIVNTLTEFEGIELVKMTVAGKPMNIEHAILEDPLPRNEDMIQR
jgi:germination protein M